MATTEASEFEIVAPSIWQQTQNKRGSPLNDWFRWWHKKIGPGYYGADLDLFLHAKNPAGIVAALDFKGPDEEPLGFSHVQVYNGLMKRIRVYIVELQNHLDWCDIPVAHNGQSWLQRIAEVDGEAEPHFLVSRYLGGDWRPDPPTVFRSPAKALTGVDEWRTWERAVRSAWERAPDGCRRGDHRWRVAEVQPSKWDGELGLECSDCGLKRLWDKHSEPIPEPDW